MYTLKYSRVDMIYRENNACFAILKCLVNYAKLNRYTLKDILIILDK